MTRNTDIAREVGARDAVEASNMADLIEFTHDQLDAFADRIRAEEMERCAGVCDRLHRIQSHAFNSLGSAGCPEYDAKDCAAAIRATPTDKDGQCRNGGVM
jgi:hypothetical protein